MPIHGPRDMTMDTDSRFRAAATLYCLGGNHTKVSITAPETPATMVPQCLFRSELLFGLLLTYNCHAMQDKETEQRHADNTGREREFKTDAVYWKIRSGDSFCCDSRRRSDTQQIVNSDGTSKQVIVEIVSWYETAF